MKIILPWPSLPDLVRILCIGCAFSSLTASCSLLHLRKEVETIYDSTVLVGMVNHAAPSVNTPIVVAAYAKTGTTSAIAHYTVLHEPGPYELIVPRGEYSLVAFEDSNRDLTYQPGEAAGQYSGQVSVQRGGGVMLNLNILIARRKTPVGFPPGTAVTKNKPEPLHYTSPGVIVPLNDPLFAEANGVKGYWQPLEFFKEYGGNISFLGAYDPAKIPILFVHGATGTPQGWEYLLQHIDLNHFQPWFYYYPSGASLKAMADLLYWKIFNLQVKYQFKDLYLVAHSMGGLITRSFLVDYGQQFPSIKKFISISTPWSGDSLAEQGVKYSPGVVPAWKDMGPQSEFAQSIYRKALPTGIDYALFFGHRGNRNPLRPNNDGVVTLASQLDPRVQTEAKMVCGFDEDHSSILTSQQVAALLSTVLAPPPQTKDAAGASSGMLTVHFSTAAPLEPQTGWPVLSLVPEGQEAAEPLFLNLSGRDSGQSFGPFPAGDYRVSLWMDSFRAKPAQRLVTIGAKEAAAVDFELLPEGNVAGAITRKFYNDGDPAGIIPAPGDDLAIRTIRLSGEGDDRVLIPARGEHFNTFAHYQAGNDWAYKTAFVFFHVPQGTYALTVEADGYERYTEQRVVIPGQPSSGKGIELSPLKQP